MDNGDMPATAIFNDKGGVLDLTEGGPDMGYLAQPGRQFTIGLTKREHFAGLAMQGFASDASLELGWKESAHLAVLWADALLAELDKDNNNG